MSAEAPTTGAPQTRLQDVAREELLETALQGLALLCRERPGGVSLGELGRFLGLRTPSLENALEGGRRAVKCGHVDREAVVERVVTDASDRTRSRYVLTAHGRERVAASYGLH